VAVILLGLFMSVSRSKRQMIACFLLVSIAEFFFSKMIPAFFTGSVASFLTVSTYFSTLGQIPLLIRDKDPRYISFPLVCASMVNSTIWMFYAILVNDIPFFTSQSLALLFMTINMIFY